MVYIDIYNQKRSPTIYTSLINRKNLNQNIDISLQGNGENWGKDYHLRLEIHKTTSKDTYKSETTPINKRLKRKMELKYQKKVESANNCQKKGICNENLGSNKRIYFHRWLQ